MRDPYLRRNVSILVALTAALAAFTPSSASAQSVGAKARPPSRAAPIGRG
jgi:hypothetical protein